MNKEIRNTIAWIVCATLVMGVAWWQAQLAVERDARARHQTLPPPLKTRYGIRPEVMPWAGDPVADYIARCEKGLTDQKIGWIIEDFQNAGLDVGMAGRMTQKEIFAFRNAQHRWYNDALVDGLRLNSEQSAEVTEKLGELFDSAKADYIEATGGPQFAEINGIWKDTNGGLIADFTSASVWLKNKSDPLDAPATNHSYQPWNLCSLTPDQEEITWKRWLKIAWNETARDQEKSSPPPDAETIKKRGIPEFLLPDPSNSRKDYLIKTDFIVANFIFPFLSLQKFPYTGDDPFDKSGWPLLAKVRLLHPAQLKILLLIWPESAGIIQQALDAASR